MATHPVYSDEQLGEIVDDFWKKYKPDRTVAAGHSPKIVSVLVACPVCAEESPFKAGRATVPIRFHISGECPRCGPKSSVYLDYRNDPRFRMGSEKPMDWVPGHRRRVETDFLNGDRLLPEVSCPIDRTLLDATKGGDEQGTEYTLFCRRCTNHHSFRARGHE